MISVFWLLLIAPACAMFGAFMMAMCAIAHDDDAQSKTCVECKATNWGVCRCPMIRGAHA